MSTSSKFLVIFAYLCACIEEVNEVVVDVDGRVTSPSQSKYPELPMNKKLEVQFENKSGFDCIIYWMNNRDGSRVEQAKMDFPSVTKIGTFPGHKFVYVLKSDLDKILYEVVISPYIGVITLLPEHRMSQIDENERLSFYKSYYFETGRLWKNYYPRNPLIYPYPNNISHIGQQRIARSNYSQHDAADSPKEYTLRVLCTQPLVFRIFDFLSDAECDHLISLGLQSEMKKSTVGETALSNDARTSSHIWVKREDSSIVNNIINRIGDMVGIEGEKLRPTKSAEDLQLVHYEENQYYRVHTDYGTDQENNRYITTLLYLNDVEHGGNTSFPDASDECKDENGYFGVRPIKRSALIFYNMLSDANVDPMSAHQAEPPTNGSEKWMTNLWIWDPFFRHQFSGFD